MTDPSDLRDTAAAHAADLGDQARDALRRTAEQKVDTARDAAAGQTDAVADAADAAAAQFAPGSLQAQALGRVADHVETVSSQIRQADMDRVVREASAFARRNPLLFVGAAAALGFAATRFLKARDPNPGPVAIPQGDPWSAASAHRPSSTPQGVATATPHLSRA